MKQKKWFICSKAKYNPSRLFVEVKVGEMGQVPTNRFYIASPASTQRLYRLTQRVVIR